jgi:hypothetical protein
LPPRPYGWGPRAKGWFRTRTAERAPFPPRELTLTKIDPIDLRALPSPFTSEIRSVGTLRRRWIALSHWTEGPPTAPFRLASSASGVARRRPRRFCHWYCNVMAKPMLTFLADPRRPLAEATQDVFLTTRGGTHTQSRFASGFEGAFALPVTGGAGSLLPFPCSLQPSSPYDIAVAGGAWPERMQPRKSTLDTLRHRSSDPEHVETHSGPSTLVSRAIEDPCSHAFPRRAACDRRPEVPSVESRAGLRLD